jgi:hypothetical protein
MKLRENEKNLGQIRFTGDDISLAAKMLDKISTTMEIIYYLMTRGEERAFVIMLLSTKCDRTAQMLEREKRDTDILFEINGCDGVYTIICQDTKVDGGYRFAERIMKNLKENDAKDIYLTELEVRTTKYDIKYIIFKLIEMHIKSKLEKKEQEIVFNSLR